MDCSREIQVLREDQRRGIGTVLMGMVIKLAEKLGMDKAGF